MHSNTFGFYYNLEEDKNWLVITHRHEGSTYPLSLNVNLSKKLRNTFKTNVLEYLVDDEGDIEIIRFGNADDISDYYIRISSKESLAKGKLNNIENGNTEFFFKEIDFNPFADEIKMEIILFRIFRE